MKAIVVTEHGEAGVLKLQEVQEPEAVRDQVLIRVHAAGVNPVDTYIRAGAYPNTTLPYTPGFDAAGIVERVGEGVTKFRPGERVYTSGSTSGTYAELALCPTHAVHPLPDGASFAEGAALGIPYGTAYRALFQKAKAARAETVLVHGGSGGVGTAAIQLAVAAGLKVLATSSTERGRELLTRMGADHALDHGSDSYLEEIMDITGKRGVDVILEMLANVNLAKDLSVLARFGRVIVIGSRGRIEINPRDTMSRDASIIGMLLFNTPPEEVQAIHRSIFEGLSSGNLKAVIGQEFPLAEAAQAHDAVLAPGSYGKIVLKP